MSVHVIRSLFYQAKIETTRAQKALIFPKVLEYITWLHVIYNISEAIIAGTKLRLHIRGCHPQEIFFYFSRRIFMSEISNSA